MKTSISILGMTMWAPLLAMAGCHHQPARPTPVKAASHGIEATQARLVLPVIKGSPGAAYFELDNNSSAPATLVHVDVVGAQSAEMHETSGGTMQPLAQVRVDPGQKAVFAPGGKHVMVFSLATTLAVGGTSTIVLHFQDGKTTSAPLVIEKAGGGSGDMAGMGAKP